jgi:transcriptional regulator with XRE-family HTH domain
MVIGDRLKELRELKNFSQGDIEKRTGLLRCYVSRVENGHTVPSVETLEKMARALEIPMYRLFHDGDAPARAPAVFKQESSDEGLWGSSGKDAKFLKQFRRLLGKASEQDRKLILYTLQKMAR